MCIAQKEFIMSLSWHPFLPFNICMTKWYVCYIIWGLDTWYNFKAFELFSGAQIGTVAGTALSGVLIQYSSIGWPSVFYLFGSLGVLWFVAWVALCYNDPQSHPFISDEEKAFLEQSIGGLDNKKVSVMSYHVQTSYTNNKIMWQNY